MSLSIERNIKAVIKHFQWVSYIFSLWIIRGSKGLDWKTTGFGIIIQILACTFYFSLDWVLILWNPLLFLKPLISVLEWLIYNPHLKQKWFCLTPVLDRHLWGAIRQGEIIFFLRCSAFFSWKISVEIAWFTTCR